MSWMFGFGLAAVLGSGLVARFGRLRNGRADVAAPGTSAGIGDPPGPRSEAGRPAPGRHFRAAPHAAAGRLSSAFAMMNPPSGFRGEDLAMGHAAMGRRTWPNPAEPRDVRPSPRQERE
ncbi:MAG: hypothetical protein ACYDIE_04275, partial [Candidatus Krumholzibacteriia bacterium]